MHILMVAAENGALAGAKVGGIGDVIRDAPLALARAGQRVTVLTPGYQSLSQLPGAQPLLTMTVRFAAALETLTLYQIIQPDDVAGVRHLVLEHPLFAACGIGAIYCHDADEPFATDAAKFALFSAAVIHAVATHAIADVDVVHLHDWHTALVLLLRNSDTNYRSLQQLPMVYTIHNLSLQGVRPFDDNWSSPSQWFPHLHYDRTPVADPRFPHCINLMRTGINLADQVHVVSPRYAAEILLPSVPESGLIRGEGLEMDLLALQNQGRLHGILNGCEYHEDSTAARKPTRKQMLDQVQQTLQTWVGTRVQIPAAWFHAGQRVQQWVAAAMPGKFVLASIGRLTPQKVRLLQIKLASGRYVLDHILELLDDGCLLMLGNGDPVCELFMQEAMLRHANFLFLCGYDEKLGNMLYNYCDAFLMPSSYEPCGISQLLALRAGKPVLVHAVGGLADTIQNGINGFSFEGKDELEQANNLVATLAEILQIFQGRLPHWRKLCRNAAATRFSWDQTVAGYLQHLYGVKSR